ncbi:MAG: hypothetical protein RLZZ622_1390 [Planctomycetota bacterium]|jgi:hypothetical protein|nr:hypothetical protein [Planctomycetia bacterium]
MVFLKNFRPFVAGLAVVLSASLASADLVSGPQPGDRVGAFTVTKVAGNANDGVAEGKSLCYRCKMGNRPVVMIFARTADQSLAKLINELEEELKEHEADKLTGFVNMIGSDAESLKVAAAKFVKDNGIERVAFVVPEDAENGPGNLNIAPDADLTVVCYKGGKVEASHAFKKGELNDDTIGAVVEASCSLVE